MVSTNRQIICVVDDQVSMHKTVTRLLEGLDVHVMSFGSAKECLEYLSKCQCHLLMVDLDMSGLDGAPVARQRHGSLAVSDDGHWIWRCALGCQSPQTGRVGVY
ncbi:MAG: response regulator [Phycisphaeraceae bacterium]|nr:response regulator [Phycisphaeraceae bacterium]